MKIITNAKIPKLNKSEAIIFKCKYCNKHLEKKDSQKELRLKE